MSMASGVPLIVVPPYAKAQHISHQQHDFGSIWNFIDSSLQLGGCAKSKRARNLSAPKLQISQFRCSP